VRLSSVTFLSSLVLLMWGLTGCVKERKDDPRCNPRMSQDVYRAKCYMEGNLIYDADVVCPEKWYASSIEYDWAYDKDSGSKVLLDSDDVKCFVLKKTE